MAGAPGDGTPGSSSAVVVNYRAVDHLVGCVESLRADGIGEIVVVDNASGDPCESAMGALGIPVTFLQLDRNVGYGAAANRGVQRATGDMVVICNPDVVVTPGTVEALREALAGEQVGAAGPRIDRTDGTRYPSARAFPSVIDAAGHGFLGLLTASNRFSRRYLRTDAEDAGPVDWVSGAFMAVRRDAFDAIGGFDEAFFMFMEDVDLCWRLWRAGWEVRYAPGGRVVHVEGVSRASAPYRMLAAHHRSLWRYARRTTTGRARVWLPAVAVGLIARMLLMFGRQAWRSRGSGGRPVL